VSKKQRKNWFFLIFRVKQPSPREKGTNKSLKRRKKKHNFFVDKKIFTIFAA